jgi:hypothetical protein
MTLAEKLRRYNEVYQSIEDHSVTRVQQTEMENLEAEIEQEGFYLLRIYTDRIPPQVSGDYSGEDMIDLFVLRATGYTLKEYKTR